MNFDNYTIYRFDRASCDNFRYRNCGVLITVNSTIKTKALIIVFIAQSHLDLNTLIFGSVYFVQHLQTILISYVLTMLDYAMVNSEAKVILLSVLIYHAINYNQLIH